LKLRKIEIEFFSRSGNTTVTVFTVEGYKYGLMFPKLIPLREAQINGKKVELYTKYEVSN